MIHAVKGCDLYVCAACKGLRHEGYMAMRKPLSNCIKLKQLKKGDSRPALSPRGQQPTYEATYRLHSPARLLSCVES